MPSTLNGLGIFITLLIPGLLHQAQRRQLAPQPAQSNLVEAGSILAISLLTNAVVLSAFGVLRWIWPEHTPNVGKLLLHPGSYTRDHLPYVSAWALALVSASALLAIVLARWGWLRRSFTGRFSPIIVSVSAWYHVFESGPPNTYVFVGCQLTNGDYISGRLEWYSTLIDETGDRELSIADPLMLRSKGAAAATSVTASRIVLAARNIARIDVSYVNA